MVLNHPDIKLGYILKGRARFVKAQQFDRPKFIPAGIDDHRVPVTAVNSEPLEAIAWFFSVRGTHALPKLAYNSLREERM